MQWLEAERKKRRLSRREVARRLGYPSATRIGQYVRQKIFAGPDLLQRWALAVEVSPIEALWRAKHYDAVFGYLHELHRLGWAWMRDDGVGHLGESAMFHRQHVQLGEPQQSVVDVREVPPELQHRYHQATIYNEAGIFDTLSLPRPYACAIFLGIGIFARRGDKLRAEAASFTEGVTRIASAMLPLAESVTIPHKFEGNRRLLKEAEKVLPWRYFGNTTRLSVVSEYVQAWCNLLCKPYADYARLALYEKPGLLGNFTDETEGWDYLRADIPSLDALSLQQA